ncbi:MAG: HAD family hydrolase [Oscillospiraceae bacterium]|nr:HAD family hydrolase [Oscillospiraceae bacterium]
MKYTTYIFDFDFTLADAGAGIIASANHALKQLGFPESDPEDIRQTVGMTLHDTFTALTGVQDEELREKFTFTFKRKADEIMTDNTVLFADTIDVLRRLKKENCKTAIVTTKDHYRIDEVLEKYDIPELIDYIVGFEDVVATKPSPEGLFKTIAHLDVEKSVALYVGDSLIDANAALNASMDFGAVITGTTPASEFQALPHVCIARNLTELMEYVNPAGGK